MTHVAPVRLYDDLREPIVIPGTSVEKLRDLTHYGSDSPARWKSGYKKDYPYHQPSDLEIPDPLGLRQTGEVILKYENIPSGVSATRSLHAPIPFEKPERDFPWSARLGFNREFLGGDSRLTNFNTTTNKLEHPAHPVTERPQLDKIMRIEQCYNVPVGDPRMNNQHIRAKNIEEYPKFGVVERMPPAFTGHEPIQITEVMKDTYHDKFADSTTTHSTHRAFDDADFAQKRLFKEELTPKSVLFTVTSKGTPRSEAHHEYKPFTVDQMKSALPDNSGSSGLDCKNIFYKDPRVTTPKSTSQSVHTARDPTFNNGLRKSQVNQTYGDVVGEDMKIEDKFLPKYLHQQSMTQDSYPQWHSKYYRPPAETHLIYPSHIPLCMEDGPINPMVTSSQESYPAHPTKKDPVAQPSQGGISTVLPLNALPEVTTSETKDRFRQWPYIKTKLDLKDQHAMTMVEMKDVPDFRTTHDMAYVAPPLVPTIPAAPLRSRDPILNDGNGIGRGSPFEPGDQREPYRPPVKKVIP